MKRTNKLASRRLLNELQRLWGRSVRADPLTPMRFRNVKETGRTDPAHYWKGDIPQVVVFLTPPVMWSSMNSGQVEHRAINTALAEPKPDSIPWPGAGP